VADGERDDRAIGDEHATDTGAEAEVKHAAAFVTAESLHAGIVHDTYRNFESGGIVEVDPTVAKIEWFRDRVPVPHFAGIADRDTVELSIGGYFVNLFDERLWREFLARGNFGFIHFASGPNFDVRAADIDDEDVHAGALAKARWLVTALVNVFLNRSCTTVQFASLRRLPTNNF